LDDILLAATVQASQSQTLRGDILLASWGWAWGTSRNSMSLGQASFQSSPFSEKAALMSLELLNFSRGSDHLNMFMRRTAPLFFLQIALTTSFIQLWVLFDQLIIILYTFSKLIHLR
jgi:hypothetical protein